MKPPFSFSPTGAILKGVLLRGGVHNREILKMSLEALVRLSRGFGSDSRYVLAGGGNTSFKDGDCIYVKPSGVALAKICEGDFVRMSRSKIRELFKAAPPSDPAEREALAKRLMAEAVCPGSSGRPSVEAPLHELMPFKFVVHLHPAMVNGMTCSKDGKSACATLFPEALWIDYIDPGYTLSRKVADEMAAYKAKSKRDAKAVILQNHGVFVAADSEGEIESIYKGMMSALEARYKAAGIALELKTSAADSDASMAVAPKLRTWLGDGAERMTLTLAGLFEVSEGPLSPDHIVYAKSFPMISASPSKSDVEAYKAKHGFTPLVISSPGKFTLCAGKTLKDAMTVASLAADAALVRQYSMAFGGPSFLSERDRKFIENWEVESYRKKVAAAGAAGRLAGKIAVVTGAAQGFGLGIAEGLAKEGATVCVADLNFEGASKAAAGLCGKFGADKAFGAAVDISDEASVKSMVRNIVGLCGGVDLFVANAGVLKAGSVKEMSRKDWDFVTNVNYTGYFLCVKHVAPVMAAQNAEGGDWTDIVQVNSKSGLEGSNRNGAYAGSKFGGIGLTQSFAMELVSDRIKVNSICPGNFFEGPLWSDPEKGLFTQYLRSGKVPGAKSVEDVKRFYEAKIPMNRGCLPEDVVKAIVYAVEQKYETGQAIPVTGGQVMLN